MADTESLKFQNALWSESGDREDPESAGLTRTEGWPVAYEQVGANAEPEREVVNQLLREIAGAFQERIRSGGRSPWDQRLDYFQFARVTRGIHIYIATVANGPGHGNATDPSTLGQTIWRLW